jgi:hypothetical protein
MYAAWSISVGSVSKLFFGIQMEKGRAKPQKVRIRAGYLFSSLSRLNRLNTEMRSTMLGNIWVTRNRNMAVFALLKRNLNSRNPTRIVNTEKASSTIIQNTPAADAWPMRR